MREWPPSEDDLRELYHEEGLTLAEIGGLYDATDSGVLNLMKEHGIERRAAADYLRGSTGHNRADLPGTERLREMYHDKGMSLAEMGDELGVTGVTIGDRMEEHGIPRRDAKITSRRGLERLYHDMGYTLERIAGIYGVTTGGLWGRLEDFDIERAHHRDRGPSGSAVTRTGEELAAHIRRTRRDAVIDGGEPAVAPAEERDKAWPATEGDLRELYHGNGMSLEAVGDEFGVSDQTVMRRMVDLGIERRGTRARIVPPGEREERRDDEPRPATNGLAADLWDMDPGDVAPTRFDEGGTG